MTGTAFNAATCATLQGINVSSPYNSGAFNISNATGGYRLVLGTGNWSVSFVKAGFTSGYYNTPYYTNGAYFHNVSLVPIGGVAKTCGGKNTTVINSTTSIITPGVNKTTYTTTKVQNVTTGPSTPSGGLGSTAIGAIVVVVIIIIVIIAWAAMRGKKPSAHKG